MPGDSTETSKDVSAQGTLAWLLIVVALLGGLGLAAYGTVNALGAVRAGDVDTASTYTTVLAPGATLMLVGLTGWYVRETQKLRIDERERVASERERTKQNVRRAFLAEVAAVENIEQLATNRSADQLAQMRRIVPTAMYEQNCAQLGMLSPDEVDAIVDYYGTAQSIEDLAYSHRAGMDASDELTAKLGELHCYQQQATTALDSHLESIGDESTE